MRLKKRFILLAAILFVILGVGLWIRANRHEPQYGLEKENGLYWYGRNQVSQKAEAGQANPYYDPDKPVIIFVHGWAPLQADTPPTFLFDYVDEEREITYNIDLAEAWIDDGWNVGIYYWHPFADEDAVWDAEDKIWTAESEVGMRWRDAEGNYHTENMPDKSASVLFYEAYLAALDDFAGDEIRVAGHSLGNQMATLLTLQLLDGIEAGEVSAALLPTRLTLLDPFWSPFGKDYLDGEETGTVLRRDILQKIIPQEIAVEWIRSSVLTDMSMRGAFASELQAETTYLELAPEFCAALDQVCRHNAAWYLYFLSYASPQLPECVAAPGSEVCVPTGSSAPMAGMGSAEVLALMKRPYGWVQVVGAGGEDGRITPVTGDDWFTRLAKEGE